MDNSGLSTQNTNTSPFAPVDIPDLNNIAAPSAMPPMGSASVAEQGKSADVKNVAQTKPSADVGSAVKPVETKNAEKNADTTSTKVTGAPKVDVKVGVAGATASTGVVNAAKPVVKDATVASANLPTNSTEMGGLVIETLLEECIKHNASDLHLQVGLPPILRIDGVLQSMTTYPILTDMMVQTLVFSTLDADQKVILKKDKEFDYSFAFGDLGRFRVNAFSEKGNMAAAFRLIPNVI